MTYVTLEDYPYYEIYDNGMIIRAKRLSNSGRALKRREICPTKTQNGYRTVSLYNREGVLKRFYLHRLVYLAFYGDIAGLEIDHKDGNRDNCAKSNLRAVSHRANCSNEVSKKRYRIANSVDKGKYDYERLKLARTKEYQDKLVETYHSLYQEHGKVSVMMLLKVGHCNFYRAKRIIKEMEEKCM